MAKSRTESPTTPEPDGDDRVEGLFEEYKLVQSKIDKIGDFRYRVRGWCVTLTTGVLAATIGSKIPWWYSLFGLVPVALFAMNEHNQQAVSDTLADRAVAIEEEIEKLNGAKESGPSFGRLLRALSDKARERRFAFVLPPRGRRRLLRWIKHNWLVAVWRSDVWFYWGQVAVIFVVAVLSGRTESTAKKLAEPRKDTLTNIVVFAPGTLLTNTVHLNNFTSNTTVFTNIHVTTNFVMVSNSIFVTNAPNH